VNHKCCSRTPVTNLTTGKEQGNVTGQTEEAIDEAAEGFLMVGPAAWETGIGRDQGSLWEESGNWDWKRLISDVCVYGSCS